MQKISLKFSAKIFILKTFRPMRVTWKLPQFLIFGLSISYYIATCGYMEDYFPGLSGYFDSDQSQWPIYLSVFMWKLNLLQVMVLTSSSHSFDSGDGKMLVNRFSLFAKVQIWMIATLCVSNFSQNMMKILFIVLVIALI